MSLLARVPRKQDSAHLSDEPVTAVRITANIGAEIGLRVKRIALDNSVSESSIIEIALRQLFARVAPETLGAFLRQNGACLRRKNQ